jgi:type II secretory pathway pseudopilin PulG
MVTRRTAAVRRAFALIDVIVGTILLGISLAAVIGLTGRALTSQQRGEELQTAAMLADEQLSLVLARGPDDYTRRFSASGACDAPFQNFRYSLNFSGGSGITPYIVTATITWAAGGILGGHEHSLAIQTFVAPREGDDPDPDRKPPDTTTTRAP